MDNTKVIKKGLGDTKFGKFFSKHNESLAIAIVVVMVAFLGITSKYFFLEPNLDSLQTAIAPRAIVAIGMMMLLITGVFDMSVGSVMCLGGLVSAMILCDPTMSNREVFSEGIHVTVAIIAGLASGALVGVINGFLVEIAGVNALITTIGTMYAVRGTTEIVLGARGKYGYRDFPESFDALGTSRIAGIYYTFILMILLIVGMSLFLKYTKTGRRLYFIGGNEDAAKKMGIKTKKIRIGAFILSGFCAALAGLMITSRSGNANRYTGQTTHMEVIIGCIIGGGSMNGGKGNFVGALFGVMVLSLLTNAFNLFNIDQQLQSLTIGVVLLVVVAMDGYLNIRKQKALGKL